MGPASVLTMKPDCSMLRGDFIGLCLSNTPSSDLFNKWCSKPLCSTHSIKNPAPLCISNQQNPGQKILICSVCVIFWDRPGRETVLSLKDQSPGRIVKETPDHLPRVKGVLVLR